MDFLLFNTYRNKITTQKKYAGTHVNRLYSKFLCRAVLCISILIPMIYSCNGNHHPAKSLNEPPVITNHGVEIRYSEKGTGDTAILFIHGWGINRTYWANQMAHFAKKYRVVSVDLPGFGQSGKNRRSWSAETYAVDIQMVIQKLNLRHVILVGHSMSGAIVVETAIKYPDRIIGVVGIDNLKDVALTSSEESQAEWSAFYDTLRMHYSQTVSKNMSYLFVSATPLAIQNRVITDMLQSDSIIAVDCLKSLDAYPFSTKLPALHKPLFLINCNYFPTDTAGLQQYTKDFRLWEISNSGHYPMLEQPAEFNRLLQQVCTELAVGHSR